MDETERLDRQRSRTERVAKVFDLDAAQRACTARSRVAFARTEGVAPSTQRGWEKRAREPDLAEPVRLFFESPDGLRLLHRVVVAALVVIVLMGGGGVGLVRTFLAWCGLDRLVACSDRHLHGRVQALLQAAESWSVAERARLAAAMTARTIGLCVDETFHDGMLLVAQDLLSGYLLVEKRSDRRDADTWNAALQEGLAGLPVTVEQVTSDEAEGLLSLTRKHLKAHHNSDVFHGVALLIARKRTRTVLGRRARGALEDVGLPILNVELGDRMTYPEAVGAGMGPTTYASGSLAAQEVVSLVNELDRRRPLAPGAAAPRREGGLSRGPGQAPRRHASTAADAAQARRARGRRRAVPRGRPPPAPVEHSRASADAREHPRIDAPAAPSTTRVTRQDGRKLCRTTVHLDEDVDRELRAHCRAQGRGCELSYVINEALRAYLWVGRGP